MRDGSTKTVMVKTLTTVLSIAALAACTHATSDGVDTNTVEGQLGGKGCIAAYGSGCGSAPPNEDIPMNGLSTRALAANLLSASWENSEIFVNRPLSVDAFSSIPALSAALGHQDTRTFLRYTLRCALAPSQSFHMSGVTPFGVSWTIDEKGVAGVCPEWAFSSADVACQQRVSACLLAENNPMNKHIPISLRGAIEVDSEPLRPRVPSVSIAEKDSGTEAIDLIPSFATCASGFGTGPDCGWGTPSAIAYVGLCTPGHLIAIGTGGAAPSACAGERLGSSPNDTVIRVCNGLRGCDAAGDIIGSNDDSCGLQSYMTFTCPSNAPVPGASGPRGLGSFSVMIASYNRSLGLEARSLANDLTAATGTTTLEYPAPEVDVFSIREGAFFGNIFDRDALTWTYTLNGNDGIDPRQRRQLGRYPTQYQNMWACGDRGFKDAAARTLQRVCTTTSRECLATPLGVCQQGVCSPSVAADGSFRECRAPNGVSFPPLTTYLHGPNDLFSGR